MFEEFPPPAAPPEARVCKMFQGLPPPRPRPSPLLQSVSRFPPPRLRRGPLLRSVLRVPSPVSWPMPAYAKWFKDSRPRCPAEARCCRMCHGVPLLRSRKQTPQALQGHLLRTTVPASAQAVQFVHFSQAKQNGKVHMLFCLSIDSSTSFWSCVKTWSAA